MNSEQSARQIGDSHSKTNTHSLPNNNYLLPFYFALVVSVGCGVEEGKISSNVHMCLCLCAESKKVFDEQKILSIIVSGLLTH